MAAMFKCNDSFIQVCVNINNLSTTCSQVPITNISITKIMIVKMNNFKFKKLRKDLEKILKYVLVQFLV